LGSIDKKRLFSHDGSDMTAKVVEFPDQIRKGWENAERQEFAGNLKPYRNIVYGGMGGSAIAGDLIRSLYADHLPIPFVVLRGYRLPAFAGPETLFIASSYSGNTEESLSAAGQAVQKKCSVLCIASGGNLAKMALDHRFPLFLLPKGYPPRGALGFGMGTLLNVFTRMGVGSLSETALLEALADIERCGSSWRDPENPDNLPFILARKLAGKIPLIYADTDKLEPVALRWKTQFNENSKTHAFFAPLPEMNHNEIIAWVNLDGTRTFYPHLTALVLRTPDEHPRVAMRMEITRELIQKNNGTVVEVRPEGNDALGRMLYLIHLGDWVSLYLALLYGADPTEINNINYLKTKLSQKV